MGSALTQHNEIYTRSLHIVLSVACHKISNFVPANDDSIEGPIIQGPQNAKYKQEIT